ncbi:MAG: S41 family peptidase [Defluviitaleaceae bacterium]|nr:S41 family peptidase [Defluviitaleaceae bacterium]
MKYFRNTIALLTLALTLILTACDYNDDLNNSIAIQNHQYIQDYDYMVETLRQNFPYTGIASRRFGIDFEANIAAGRELLFAEEIIDNAQFIQHISRHIINPMRQLGHLSVQSTDNLHLILGNIYRGPINYNGEFIDLGEYAITYWGAKFEQLVRSDIAQKHYGNIEVDLGAYEPQMIRRNNLTTHIVDDELGVALVRVSQFWHYNIDHDLQIMKEFYSEIEDFNHLILDFRGNPGGFTRYFIQLFMAPNVSQDLEFSVYTLFMGGDHNLAWFEADTNDARAFADTDLIKHNAADYMAGGFPLFNADDAAFLDYIIPRPIEIRSTGEMLFDGKIWILIDDNSASAVEYAAMYARATGFATIVGAPTRGVTGGGLVGFFALPNSGIIIRYDFGLFIDEYGRAIDEYGVMPDYFNREGLNALETTLELIREMEEK